MAVSRSSSKEKDTATGEKHQTEHESPESKRTKTKEDRTASNEDNNGNTDNAVQPAPDSGMPSNALEKGIIYFFIRRRVNADEPEGVDDIARSYMLLRPISKGARLSKGPMGDSRNTRVLALPKKTFPVHQNDKFMVLVDMSKASYQELEDDFLASSEYTTKTVGTRDKPQATPIAEVVYAITSTGRESHFEYILTLPQKLDEVQKVLGLKRQGSFILSTKNPKYPGSANTRLPQSPEFPKEIIEDFRDLYWMPSKPAHLNHVNAQVLLFGEPSGIEKATKFRDEEQIKGKGNKEVLENLAEDDLERMQHLGGDESESIFADLHVQANDYPALQATF